jgi:anti-anti-sigma regulatory factor
MTLKIQRSVERRSVVLILTGRIQADQVPDLEALLKSESSDRDIVLDLGHVKLVDRDAVQFLAGREAAGTELRNCSAYIREWIMQEKNAMQRKGAENAAGLAG